ncbi:hypothetical protein [Paenibacillus agilis]|uniref:DUF3221 domain-containing protein n=1 Tax=Paenibacillus agilis TaxID=3020863 RepID=A0A559J1Q2_9BACL|nr:hypothetical protein [Paenibacillus agilis]TVX93812.1 hypothetical protein FPZ44_12570 [Paenibacillus agilis]
MKKLFISLLGSTIVFIVIVWASETKSTGEVVRIKEINHGSILVENSSGIEKDVEIPKIITKLIIKNEEYYISYNKTRWSGWKLKEIEPIKI